MAGSRTPRGWTPVDDEEIAVLQRDLRDTKRMLHAIVAAVGGEVAVPRDLLTAVSGSIVRHDDLVTGDVVLSTDPEDDDESA